MNTLNQKPLIVQIITLSFLGDLVLLAYIYFVYSAPSFLGPLVKKVMDFNGASDQMDQMSLTMLESQLVELSYRSLMSALALILILHSIIYFFFYREKKLAANYIRSYAYTAVIGSFLTFILSLSDFKKETFAFLILGIIYIFVLGLLKRVRFKKKKAQ